MTKPFAGAIDCDIHPAVPGLRALLPYLDEYWADQVIARGIDRQNLDITSYPSTTPLASRPDWRPAKGAPGSNFDMLQSQALDGFGSRFAICNPIHFAQILANEYMAAALCKAVNDWIAKEWLDRDPRLRGSILIPPEAPELAVQEIERLAPDKRFVQVLTLVMGPMPLGKRFHWPIYEAAERHGLAIGVHAGSMYRQAPTSVGWPTYYLEDYIAQAQAFQDQINSLVAEGVFLKYPKLKVVLLESGFTWLPSWMWRADKTWRGTRAEVPWVNQAPSQYLHDNIRVTIQPTDKPPEPQQLTRTIEQIGSDKVLLFATDYPHWQFDGDDAMPAGVPDSMVQKILVDNALETYPRLSQH